MMLKVISSVFCFAAAASASIAAIVPFNETFHATKTSTMTVTFSTANGLSPVYDWSAAIGVMPAENRTDPSALGTFVKNVDLFALGYSITGTSTFSITVPVNTSSAITHGSGKYVLTAAIMSSAGVSESSFAKIINQTFTATVE